MLEGLAQGARNVRYAGQDDVPSCFPQGMEQMRRCFRLHGGSVRKLPAFQLLRAVLRQPVHVRPAFVTARAGILGHAAGNALVRHGVFKALQAARHFQHAGKILRHVPGEQARIKTVGRGSQRLEPAGQLFQDGSRFLLFPPAGELVRRNNLGAKMACALEMEARYSLNCLPDSRVGTSTRFRWKSFPRESACATARQAGLSQDRKSRFMAGKQDSPERGKGGDYGPPFAGAYFPIYFFRGCQGGGWEIMECQVALALREGCLFCIRGFLPGKEGFRFLDGSFSAPFVEGFFSLLCSARRP